MDLNAVPALSEERERLWARLRGADFLTLDEKRVAVPLGQQVIANRLSF